MKEEGETGSGKGFVVTNGMIATLISVWFIWTQVKDAVVASANRNSVQKSNTEAVGRHTDALAGLLGQDGSLDQLGEQMQVMVNDLAQLRGAQAAERARAYEAETGLAKDTSRLEAEMATFHSQVAEGGVDLAPVLAALAAIRADMDALRKAIAADGDGPVP